MDLHGGTISVTSAGEGQGTTFSITLPVYRKVAESVHSSSSLHSVTRSVKRSVGSSYHSILSHLSSISGRHNINAYHERDETDTPTGYAADKGSDCMDGPNSNITIEDGHDIPAMHDRSRCNNNNITNNTHNQIHILSIQNNHNHNNHFNHHHNNNLGQGHGHGPHTRLLQFAMHSAQNTKKVVCENPSEMHSTDQSIEISISSTTCNKSDSGKLLPNDNNNNNMELNNSNSIIINLSEVPNNMPSQFSREYVQHNLNNSLDSSKTKGDISIQVNQNTRQSPRHLESTKTCIRYDNENNEIDLTYECLSDKKRLYERMKIENEKNEEEVQIQIRSNRQMLSYNTTTPLIDNEITPSPSLKILSDSQYTQSKHRNSEKHTQIHPKTTISNAIEFNIQRQRSHNSEEDLDISTYSAETRTERFRSSVTNLTMDPFESIKCLVVDDSTINRRMVVRLLKSKGLSNILEAFNGVQAVNIVNANLQRQHQYQHQQSTLMNTHHQQQQPQQPLPQPPRQAKPTDILNTNPNIILIDYYMPQMNGPEATREIRKLGYAGVIIGVSGSNSSSDMQDFLDSGADNVLHKPISISELDKVLMEAVSRINKSFGLDTIVEKDISDHSTAAKRTVPLNQNNVTTNQLNHKMMSRRDTRKI